MTILHELTQGTSWWDATCTRVGTSEVWLICWKYSFPEDFATVLEWCTLSDDPLPPPPFDPGPPPPDWPDEFEGLGLSLFPQGGTVTCWDVLPYDGPTLDLDIGPWGGFRAWFAGTGVGDMMIELYPASWTPGTITWRCHMFVIGAGSADRDELVFSGFSPVFQYLAGTVPGCPAVWLAVITSFPP